MGTSRMEVKLRQVASDLPPDFKFKESTWYIDDLTEDDKGQRTEMSDCDLENK